MDALWYFFFLLKPSLDCSELSRAISVLLHSTNPKFEINMKCFFVYLRWLTMIGRLSLPPLSMRDHCKFHW